MLQSSLKQLRSSVAVVSALQHHGRFVKSGSIVLSRRWASGPATLQDSYEHIQVDATYFDKGVGVITLNRPKALNALCDALFVDLIHAAKALDQDDAIGCLVLTGAGKAFAAGADIAEMKDRTFDYAYKKVPDY